MFNRLFAATALIFSLLIASQSLSYAADPIFTVSGKIALRGDSTEIAISEAVFAEIGKTEIETKIPTLGDGMHRASGILGRDLLKYLGAQGKTLRFIGLDAYAMDIPIADFLDYDVVIATEIDGKPLSVRSKGPAWLIYPISSHPELDDPVYSQRGVWQIASIEIK